MTTLKEMPDYIVNPIDLSENFWGNDYLVLLTRFGISFLVNASYEQAALDEVMDFITNRTENGEENLSGLYSDQMCGDFITAGNYSYCFTTDNIRVIEL